MTEHEIEAITNYAERIEKYNKRFYTLCLVLVGALLAVCIGGLTTINSINSRMAEMSVNQWETYMEADYYYPAINQEQKVEVSN